MTIYDLMEDIQQFTEERDWSQFHTHKDLAIGLSIEASELLDLFKFRTEDDIEDRMDSREHRYEVMEEIADVLIYALMMCQKVKCDPLSIIKYKLAVNASKYPVDKSKGSNEKYTNLS